ncbi:MULTISPECIES: ATP-binding protein [Actinoplanes]|uniref:ATP-binding protein n=1 Tax=Actinoplanes TaxID=1865 RepID=UPI0005F2814E|nr:MULTISPECIES: ATP-binding protein [Actinoplanes]GLY02493.1 hypothetical protein Acsp01_28720 [Actinoplanes sp. NBRC 101535]
MEVHPPFLFAHDAMAATGTVAVQGDLHADITVVSVHGRWSAALRRQTSVTLRRCLIGQPAGLLLDLTSLDDPTGRGVPTWVAARRRAGALDPPVPLALAVPPGMSLAAHLRPALVTRGSVDEARRALEERLPAVPRISDRLTNDRSAPGLARRLAEQACTGWGLPDLLAPARLVISELVSNAVEHTTGPARVAITRRGSGLRLSVADASRELPRTGVRPGPSGGRGLQIIQAAAAAWGAMPVPGGKLVWATIQSPVGYA